MKSFNELKPGDVIYTLSKYNNISNGITEYIVKRVRIFKNNSRIYVSFFGVKSLLVIPRYKINSDTYSNNSDIFSISKENLLKKSEEYIIKALDKELKDLEKLEEEIKLAKNIISKLVVINEELL